MLQPYCGDQVERKSKLGKSYSVRTFEDKPGGAKIYHFNSLGFRGEDFNPSAKMKIFAFGCSQTFGTGLNDDEIWPVQFTRMLSRRRKIKSQNLCVMNFGEAGASNDYISRAVLTQCSMSKPDLVLVQLTKNGRMEGFEDESSPFRIGPWLNFSFFRRCREYLNMPRSMKKIGWKRMTGAARYYEYYSDPVGVANALRNLLQIQYYCHAENIRAVISWHDYNCLRKHIYANNPAFSPLISLIDPATVCKFVLKEEKLTDVAADGWHPGPMSNRKFARRLMRFYEKQLPRRQQRVQT